MSSHQVFRIQSAAVLCLIFITSSSAFFAPFLHEAAASLDDDVVALSRTRRNTLPAITPGILDHSGRQEVHHIDQHRNSSSMFMVELFESLYTGHNLVNPSAEECRAIEAADTVRSYIGRIQDTNSSSSDVMSWVTSFPTFDQPIDDAVHLAELRVQLNTTSEQWSSRRFVMQLHQSTTVSCDNGDVGECRKRKLLHSRNIDAHHDDFDGKEVFDITKVVHQWIATRKDDASSQPIEYSIELRVKSLADSDDDHDRDVLKALLAADRLQDDIDDDLAVESNNVPVSTDNGDSLFEHILIKDVTLVVFSRAFHSPVILSDAFNSVRVRRRRSTEEARRRKKQRDFRKYQREQEKQRLAEKLRLEQERSGPCRKVEMNVDFSRIGWDEWIIYPKKFNAFRCVGTCSGPLSDTDNPTNHAIMQDLIRIHQPERRTPEPCCVPTKLRPLSMLYFEEGAVLVRHHENMIVQECGCR